MFSGGQPHSPSTEPTDAGMAWYAPFHVHALGPIGEGKSLCLPAPLAIHAAYELETAVQLGRTDHLIFPHPPMHSILIGTACAEGVLLRIFLAIGSAMNQI
jgi:hypothetical protein